MRQPHSGVLPCNPDPGRSASGVGRQRECPASAEHLDLRGNMGDVGDGLTEPDADTGSNHGQGSNGRRINDDDYQDVNITNIDPDSPSAIGMWEEGVD